MIARFPGWGVAAVVLVFSIVTVAEAQDSLAGTWTARRSESGFRVTLYDTEPGRQHVNSLRFSDLPSDEVNLRVERESGIIELDGRRRGDRAAGFFVFRPKTEFNARMSQFGYGPFDLEQLLLFAELDARITEVRRLEELGYSNLSNDDLLALFIHGALADHILDMREVGFDHLSVEDLLSTRIHDVTPEFVKAISALGLETRSIEKVIAMRIFDVTPEYVTSMRELGYKNLSVDDLIEMRVHDVTPEYARALNKKLGGRN